MDNVVEAQGDADQSRQNGSMIHKMQTFTSLWTTEIEKSQRSSF